MCDKNKKTKRKAQSEKIVILLVQAQCVCQGGKSDEEPTKNVLLINLLQLCKETNKQMCAIEKRIHQEAP